MNHVFNPNFFTDRDASSNMVHMNSLLMDMVSKSSFCDCQSMPLKDHFVDFYATARFSVETTFDKLLSAAPIELSPTRVFERFLQATPYTDFMQYRAEIPEGLCVTYLEYLAVLLPAQQRANDLIKNILDPYSKFIGKLISDEVFRNQLTHQIKELSNLESDHAVIQKAFAKCFSKNDFGSTAPVADVVRRNADWSAVFSQTTQLRKLYQAFPHQEVTKKLNTLYDMVDTLVEQIKLDQYVGVDKTLTVQLSTGLYSIAREVEMAATTTFSSRVFIESINTTIKSVEVSAAARAA